MNKILRFILATFCVCLFGGLGATAKQPNNNAIKVETCEYMFRSVILADKKDRVNFCSKKAMASYESLIKTTNNSKAYALKDGYKFVKNGDGFFVALNPSTRHVIPFAYEFINYDGSPAKVVYKVGRNQQVCIGLHGTISPLDGIGQSVDVDYGDDEGFCFKFNKKDGFVKSSLVNYKTMRVIYSY